MSVPSFSIREYRADDETAVLALLYQSLGNGRAFARTSAFWRWKHFQNPFGPSLMVVAANGEILGLRAFMRWQFRVGARTITAVRAVDTATHPMHRRHGVFSALSRLTVERARAEGIDLIFNTPNRVSLPGYLKLGWTYVGRPHLLVRILKPARVIGALVRKTARNEVEGPVLTAPVVPSEMLLRRSGVLEPLLAQDDHLCADGIRTNRTMAFLRWRYMGGSSLSYYAFWRGVEPSTVVAILRPNLRRGLREIMLCEMLLSRAGVRDVPGLIRDLIEAVDADYLVAHAPLRSVHWQALVRAGFLPIPRLGPHFAVRPLTPGGVGVFPTRLVRWHLSLGDLEVF